MEPVVEHARKPHVSFDGGDLDCGGGLLLLIRRHIDPMNAGELLEIRSTEPSVEQDLPAWCRLTGNELVSWTRQGKQRSYMVSKGRFAGGGEDEERTTAASAQGKLEVKPVRIPEKLPLPSSAPEIRELAVMGIGSWPRPRWMLQAIHERLESRLGEEEFQATADDAVRLAIEAQTRAGVDVVTDGEQRRDSYASFAGALLDNCHLVPLTDLAAMVEHRDEFEREMRALDVPAADVRHPVVYGPLGRSRPLAVHELAFAKTVTEKPVKVALPGPYLLTRTMWLDCLRDLPYKTREALAEDVVRVLREEIHELLHQGAALVQLDEPVLTEVIFSPPMRRRSFMCGALSDKRPPAEELAFARDLINGVVAGLPSSRLALHICRGNWTRDESAALQGDYQPLVPLLSKLDVGTLFLELCTPRSGNARVLRSLPDHLRLGVGVVNQKLDQVEAPEQIAGRVKELLGCFDRERLLLTPDCGFATFADNPVSSARVAEAKLRAIAQARDSLAI